MGTGRMTHFQMKEDGMHSFFQLCTCFLVGVQLPYKIVLVSAVQKSDSAMHICFLLFWISFPFRSPQRIDYVPCAIQ